MKFTWKKKREKEIEVMDPLREEKKEELGIFEEEP